MSVPGSDRRAGFATLASQDLVSGRGGRVEKGSATQSNRVGEQGRSGKHRQEASRTAGSTGSHFTIQEGANQRCHLIELVLEREVTGIQNVHFGGRQVPQIGMCAHLRENLIVLAPYDNRRW